MREASAYFAIVPNLLNLDSERVFQAAAPEERQASLQYQAIACSSAYSKPLVYRSFQRSLQGHILGGHQVFNLWRTELAGRAREQTLHKPSRLTRPQDLT